MLNISVVLEDLAKGEFIDDFVAICPGLEERRRDPGLQDEPAAEVDASNRSYAIRDIGKL